ncbi:MAG: hypothetical protein ACRETE_00115 [Stenotrophobium sp.]
MIVPPESVAARNIHSVPPAVMPVAALERTTLERLFGLQGLYVSWVAADAAIPGSYWGDSEAGLIGNVLHLRPDTPVHSALHEACHYLCMDEARRSALHTDAKGDDIEEAGVCYLQALLASNLEGYSRARLFADMDAWGYSWRLGSALTWFEQDADDARRWLLAHGLIDDLNGVRFAGRV